MWTPSKATGPCFHIFPEGQEGGGLLHLPGKGTIFQRAVAMTEKTPSLDPASWNYLTDNIHNSFPSWLGGTGWYKGSVMKGRKWIYSLLLSNFLQAAKWSSPSIAMMLCLHYKLGSKSIDRHAFANFQSFLPVSAYTSWICHLLISAEWQTSILSFFKVWNEIGYKQHDHFYENNRTLCHRTINLITSKQT